MRKIRLLLTLLCLWVGLLPALAQSVTITREMQQVQMASVLAMYKNEFGSFEKPDMSDTFPFAVIRMHLEGNAHDVKAAKERLTLYMGQQTGVEARVTTYSNQILFLVRSRRPMIFIDCGDGCEQVLLSNMQKLKSNCLYDCTVRFRTERSIDATIDTVFVNEGPKIQELRLQVEPADAKVEVNTDNEHREWKLTDGIISVQLTEGEYHYTISADKYYTANGTLSVPDISDTIISLLPKFAWLSIESDSIDLTDSSVEIFRLSHGNMGSRYSLPLQKLECDTGEYKLKIKKRYHFPYSQTIILHEGERMVVQPVFRSKRIKDIKTMVLLHAGTPFKENLWGVGLMFGQLYNGYGWYMKGRSNFLTSPKTTLECEEAFEINGVTPIFLGTRKASTWTVSAGFAMDFMAKKDKRNRNNVLGMYVGAGYSYSHYTIETTSNTWVCYMPWSEKGVGIDLGLMGSIAGFTVSAGANVVNFRQIGAEASIGWTF